MFLKKIILFTSALLLSNMLCAEKYQYFVNQATNQILTSPYQFFIYQPSSLIDKAIENLPAYSDVKKCASNNISDAILIIKPILFYNPQSTILYGDLNVKIYQSRSDKETHPDNFIKKMKISLWEVVKFDRVTMDYYVNNIYTKLLSKLSVEIENAQLNSDYPTNGSYCDLLNTLKESKINLRY
jgi:hypothetical protein